ncbi:phage Gp37/Gp68 family protein [Ruficoccus amylovorans]|uniref:Phage Gp37/Gp68 family protein n=1 Tax=Ruficoccus amylovorans TaxID=1804625 RepID=A0A842HFA1_9BACT|nr:phage Gp37/Gp68 family protein [Ruficoccus amylovorans]MBC2594900.1 phage Gp37/Gp68 family protein [Ruficoccus amylovorans]
MAENTKIEWCDHTFNPWMGCTKVSPGCAHCYAETRMDKRLHKVRWGKGQPRQRTGVANWKLPLKWDGEAQKATGAFDESFFNQAKLSQKRPRVFCASLADWLDHEVPTQWRVDLLNLIEQTHNLDWLLLSKRPESWSARLHEAMGGGSELARRWLNGEPPANIWVGTTVENQLLADERIPALLRIPANVRFLSCEPLLGPVNLSAIPTGEGHGLNEAFPRITMNPLRRALRDAPHVHWVITGGESGPNARPMHQDWARSLRDQCAAASVPFLFKQWGEWRPADDRDSDRPHWVGIPDGSEEDFSDSPMVRVGKKAAGRLLDAVEHNEFPQP